MENQKIAVVAMSGGVDSPAIATTRIQRNRFDGKNAGNSCCKFSCAEC